MTTAYRGRQGAHQNRRVQRFAFCRGLDFTLGYSGSIVRRGRCGEAQRCSGRGEALAAPGGYRGDAGDQSAFWICWAGPENHRLLGWSTHSPPGLRLPQLGNLPGRLRVTGSALLSRLWDK